MIALITGATGGIGQAIIDILIENNYEVIALGRNEKILKELEVKYLNKVTTFSIDFNKEIEIDMFLNFIESKNLNISLLINGAGIGEINYFENISSEKIKLLLNTNIIALTKFTKFFYNKMLLNNEGTIINISSTAGFQPGGPLMSVYYATKSYVNSFTFSLIEESKNKNLNIILLTPGPTKTNFEGMNRELKGLEKFYVTSPEEVAKECFLGIKNKKTLIIPGFINKFLYLIDKFIPLNLKLKSIKKIQEKKLKK